MISTDHSVPMLDHEALAVLQAENKRLIALLEAHGIEWRLPPAPVTPASAPEPGRLSTDEKVALFRRLFRGRTDVYPVRWESLSTGKSGYVPACANEWRKRLWEKRRRGYRAMGYRCIGDTTGGDLLP